MSYRVNEDYFEQQIQENMTLDRFKQIVEQLRVFTLNNKSNVNLIQLIEKTIEKAKNFYDYKSIVNLYGLKILLLENRRENLEKIIKIANDMENLSKENSNQEGLALTYSYWWFIEKIKVNKVKGKSFIEKAFLLIDKSKKEDPYIVHFVHYSYAIEKWLEEHDSESVKILEDCAHYFFKGGFYRSLAQTIGLLGIIYSRMHENMKALNLSNQILANRYLFENLPLDIRGIIYYFTGWIYILNANLIMAESYFNEAYNILKPIYNNSIYFSNFLVLHSYFAIVKGLQGKTEQACVLIKEAYILLQSDFMKKHLDKNTEKQIIHNLNLVNFYNISRLGNYDPQEHQELIDEIFENCKSQYSDFMSLSEFILNSDLDSDKLQKLLEINNFSINRVKHLIEFMLGKRKLTWINQEQIALSCIATLEKRITTSKTTFIEHAYADLLIAQQLFSLKHYTKISPLLKKYNNRLHRIEVLEMRIFMEAFIQVGAYKNGDPLGPALQYMAIKKCRNYGFSRLENTLLNYMNLQQKDALKAKM